MKAQQKYQNTQPKAFRCEITTRPIIRTISTRCLFCAHKHVKGVRLFFFSSFSQNHLSWSCKLNCPFRQAGCHKHRNSEAVNSYNTLVLFWNKTRYTHIKTKLKPKASHSFAPWGLQKILSLSNVFIITDSVAQLWGPYHPRFLHKIHLKDYEISHGIFF